MKLLDTVALLEDVVGIDLDGHDTQLPRGQVGTVVDDLGSEFLIVEFAGEDGVAYALSSIQRSKLLQLRRGSGQMRSLADALKAMPDVGLDEDFVREAVNR